MATQLVGLQFLPQQRLPALGLGQMSQVFGNRSGNSTVAVVNFDVGTKFTNADFGV